MLSTTGFSCCVVDAKEYTKVLDSPDSVVEAPKWRIASTWLGGAPSDRGQDPPMTVGIYIGRDPTHHTPWTHTGPSDCMVYIFRDGTLLLGHPLTSIEKSPVIISVGPQNPFHKQTGFPLQSSGNLNPFKQWPPRISMTISQLEVIVTPPWTTPIPLLCPEQYPLSNHLAYFRFSSLPTQLINVSGIALLPKNFWVHEREISTNWEPLTRRRSKKNCNISPTRSQWTMGAGQPSWDID